MRCRRLFAWKVSISTIIRLSFSSGMSYALFADRFIVILMKWCWMTSEIVCLFVSISIIVVNRAR